MKRLFAITLALLFAGSMVGCNTIEGAGKDVEKAGEKVQDASRDVKEKL